MNNARNKKDALDAIRLHYLNGTELSEKHEEMRRRLSAAFSLLTNYHSIQQAIPVLQEQFGYSESSAYRDINNAIKLFGNVLKSDKEGHRYIVYEFAVKTFQLAAKNGDHKSMAAATNNMIKLLGLDRDNPDAPDFSKLQPPPIVMIYEDQEKARIDAARAKGKVDLTEFYLNENTIDVEHEEVAQNHKNKIKDAKIGDSNKRADS